MKILMVSAEAFPFAKTGGLADAVSALAVALHKQGCDVRIVMPRYYGINKNILQKLEGPLGIPCGYKEEWAAVYTACMPPTDSLPVYFIDHEQAFGRDGVYGSADESDFHDNPFRFAVLCQSVFQLCRKLSWFPDIIHAHDWSASLAPVLLRFNERRGEFVHTASVLTVHNLGYQGIYGKHLYPSMGLAWEHFYSSGFEDWDKMNFLKAGLTSADVLSTVSPTYAREIQTAEQGFRMDGLLKSRQKDLFGILNGVDTDVWNPASDKKIAERYTAKTIEKKCENKAALQRLLGLDVNPDIPLVVMISRLADQKGIGELFGPAYGCAYSLCSDIRLQFAVLGSGEKWCERELLTLQDKLPNFRCRIGYDDALSHLMEAGADFFLMPSRYEPCGLNQMYSLLYGTLPIVHRTGGLADTVENYDEQTGEGTGFMFDDLTPKSIYNTVGWAVYAWYNKKSHIEKMKKRAMGRHFGWSESAKKYEELYETALSKL